MPDDQQYEELQRQIAELTGRVYHLEQRAGLHPATPSEAKVKLPSDSSPHEGQLESKIGGHWLNRVGIIAVLVGVSYFLKYAFDNEWVGPAGRVLIGLISGLCVVFWSEYVRRRGRSEERRVVFRSGGVSYFLKYAFHNEWVGPAGRVLIGLISGLCVVFWSEYVRRRGDTFFSYSLKAIGIGVLYLSL